jgi:alpha-glucosidase
VDSPRWWQTGVLYQIYPRSFADAYGYGIGYLTCITAHLDYVRDLGVDAIWF